jgi:hypothetical protein
LKQRTRKVLLEELTKSYLRKASLGSNSSIATWKSQVIDNIKGMPSDKDPKKKSGMLSGQEDAAVSYKLPNLIF